MKILAIYPYTAFPQHNGGRIRGHQVLQALVSSHEVSLAALGGEADRVALARWPLAASFSKAVIIDPERAEALSTGGARLRAARPRPPWGRPSWMRSRDIPQMWNALAELPLGDYDAVHARNLHLAPYALAIRARYPAMKLVLDLDDVASVVRLRTLRASSRGWISRWRAQVYLDFVRLRLFERTYLRRFDSVWVCSQDDDRLLAGWIGRQRSSAVPNVMDTEPFEDVRRAERPRPVVLFVANFAVGLNVDAARWLCDRVWPSVRHAVPEAELWLVGHDPSVDLRARDGRDGVTIAGSVAEVKPYLAQAAVAVAPILVGGGTRLKILEAFAAGVPVVATAIGAEGIRVRHGRDILIADAPAAFAQSCVELLQSPGLRARLRDAAFALVRDDYAPSVLTGKVLECYSSL